MPAAKKIPEIARMTDGRPYAQEGFITQLFRQPENELTVSVVNVKNREMREQITQRRSYRRI